MTRLPRLGGHGGIAGFGFLVGNGPGLRMLRGHAAKHALAPDCHITETVVVGKRGGKKYVLFCDVHDSVAKGAGACEKWMLGRV